MLVTEKDVPIERFFVYIHELPGPHTRIIGTTYNFFVGPGKSTSDLSGPHTQVSILPTYRDHVEMIANTLNDVYSCLFEVKSTFTMKTNEKI